jgi:GGDEF domain-containing protein
MAEIVAQARFGIVLNGDLDQFQQFNHARGRDGGDHLKHG